LRPREAVQVEGSDVTGPPGSVVDGAVYDGLEPRCDRFALQALIDSVADRFAESARAKGIVLEIKTAHTVPTHAVGDEAGLGQTLTALVDNAVKFTDRGEVIASVTCDGVVGGRTLLHVEVSDTGSGIPDAVLEMLFDSSRDGGPPLAPAPSEGGLVHSRHLVELMDGRFGCSSRLGTGTTAWFTVPLDLPES
jgi:signal transduction histidine kinase